jgi:hypothetical protein
VGDSVVASSVRSCSGIVAVSPVQGHNHQTLILKGKAVKKSQRSTRCVRRARPAVGRGQWARKQASPHRLHTASTQRPPPRRSHYPAQRG